MIRMMFCNSLHCICDCSLQDIISSISMCSVSGINILRLDRKNREITRKTEAI